MNRLVYFLMVGLAFTVLQVSTVAAQTGMPDMPPTMGDQGGMSDLGAHCGAIQAKNEKKRMTEEVKCLRRTLHEHKPTVKLRQSEDGVGRYGCSKKKTGSRPAQIACLRGLLDAPSGTPGMAPMGDPNMPPMDMPPTDMPPMGDPNMPPPTGMSSLGDHCGAIQAKNEKKRMKKEVKCLRRALHEHKPTVKIKQTKDGLGGYGCGVRHTGSRPAQITCLRSILNGPGGTPGMPPMGDPNMPPTMGDVTGMQGEGDGFRDCKQIRPKGDLKQLRKKKNCFRDVARELGAKKSARADWKACRQIKPKGNLKQLREKKNCFRDLARSLRSGDPNMATPTGAPAMTGDRPGGKLGNYGCGNKDRLKHVNCLRDLLGTTPQFGKVKHRKEGNKTRGLYGCGRLKNLDEKWKEHTGCLRRLLDEHGPELAVR